MPDNNGDFSAFDNSLVSAIQQPNIASELIGQDDAIRKLFLTLTYFKSENEAAIYSRAIDKCDRRHLPGKKLYFLYRINAKVSVDGRRSAQIVDVLTQIQREIERTKEQRDARQQPRGVKIPNY